DVARLRHRGGRAVKIRRARPADAVELAALAERTFRAAFGADNTAEDLDLHCGRSFGPGIQGREIADPALATWVVETDVVPPDQEGSLAAYAQTRRGPAPPCVEAALPLEILRFYVDGRWHGSGLAAALMAVVLAQARELGADALWLGVWERNPRA